MMWAARSLLALRFLPANRTVRACRSAISLQLQQGFSMWIAAVSHDSRRPRMFSRAKHSNEAHKLGGHNSRADREEAVHLVRGGG